MSDAHLTYRGNLRVEGRFDGFSETYINDVVRKFGGLEEYPPPSDLIHLALGSCMLTMMALKAKSLKVNIEGTTAIAKKEVDARYRFKKFSIEIRCPHAFDEEIQEQLKDAAETCAVSQALDSSIEQEHLFIWGEE